MTRCLNQVFRPPQDLPVDGTGYCSICKTDESNKNCTSYQPIQISICGFILSELPDKDSLNGSLKQSR